MKSKWENEMDNFSGTHVPGSLFVSVIPTLLQGQGEDGNMTAQRAAEQHFNIS